MNKVALIVAILVCYIFAADKIYLRNGKEVDDASIVEIGVSDVKYKVGKKDVIYTVKKSDIAIIFFADGTKEVFDAESSKSEGTATGGVQIVQNVQNTVTPTNNAQVSVAPTGGSVESKERYYENFTTGQRWGTWALNAFALSGLGSWLIMSDVLGGFVHLGLDAAAVVAFLSSESESCDNRYSYYGSYEECTTEYDLTLFAVFYGAGAIWNIYRSASYDKPKPVAYSKYGYLNMAVLPNKRGHLMPALVYNKTF